MMLNPNDFWTCFQETPLATKESPATNDIIIVCTRHVETVVLGAKSRNRPQYVVALKQKLDEKNSIFMEEIYLRGD